MMISEQQIRVAEQGGDVDAVGQSRQTRGLSTSKQWPGGVVPYVIHTSAKNSVLNSWGVKGPTERAIHSAMNEWEQKTCVRFVPRTNQEDYIEFFDGSGCWSYVGRVGGKQQISISSSVLKPCFFHGIVLHEIGHALGFWHEQSRPDRDNYVQINWDNIKEDSKHNFRKYGHSNIDSLGVPYDYGSIMHYGKRDFARWPWQITIKTKDSSEIGQRSHLSPLDVKQMRMYYKCA